MLILFQLCVIDCGEDCFESIWVEFKFCCDSVENGDLSVEPLPEVWRVFPLSNLPDPYL
jgi:hypothetical protein